MAEALVVGAVVGAVFGESFSQFFQTVKDVSNRAWMFKSNLKRLESTLLKLMPKVEKIKGLADELIHHLKEDMESLIEQMNKGQNLVNECSKIKWWNCCLKTNYASELDELEAALVSFFNLDMQAHQLMIGMENLAGVNAILAQRNVSVSCAVPRPPASIVGFDEPLKELKLQLLQERVSLLVLHAPGGCGKTTLVKMLCQDEEIKGMFKDNIFFVPVTKSPNLMVIVDRLFSHKNYQLPFQGNEDAMEDAINQLELLLNKIKDPKLLILDDVWIGSDSIIEKFTFDMPNYKILVTSRTAFPRFSSKYTLEPLNGRDAMTLFCHHSEVSQEGNFYALQQDTIEKIVKVCGGFPLALKVIGKSLGGKSAATWQKKANDWSSSHSILDSNKDLLDCLKGTLDFSDDEVILKECFMDLGSFAGQKIPVAALIDMWAELYELDENGSIDILLEIVARNLATLVLPWKDAIEVGSYYSYNFVSQHDLLRELAIHQSNQESIAQSCKRLIIDLSGNNPPKQRPKQKQQSISAKLLSISTDQMCQSSWCDIQTPEVEVLVLNLQAVNYILPEFVQRMEKLKALIVTNYSLFTAELGNFQLLGSLPYLKKIRLEKVSIPSIEKNPVQLGSLEKMSLFMCNIGQAFRNYTSKVSDVLPNLMEVNIACCIEMEEFLSRLCDIVHLKKLSITGCFRLSKLPEGIGNLENLEVLRLRYCFDLLELPESIARLHSLRILDISDCLSIRKLPKNIGELCNLKELHMKGCLSLHNQLPQSIMDLKQLELVICDEERAKLRDFHPNIKVVVAAKDYLNMIPNHYF